MSIVINQIVKSYKVLRPKLLRYHQYIIKLLTQIPEVTIYWLCMIENVMIDVLAKLAKEMSCLGNESYR